LPNAKRIVIAGGGGLIGSAIIKAMQGQGHTVFNADINAEPPVDCSDYSNVLNLVRDWHPDIFVNACYPSDWRVHLDAFLFSSQAVSFYMANNGRGGSIINIASIYGIVGPDDAMYEGTDMSMPLEYAAVKGAIISLTRAIATRFGRYGVRANTISPGGVFDGQPDNFVQRYCNKVPLKRMATVEDIASAACFLASDEAKYVTGINLKIDGGLTAW